MIILGIETSCDETAASIIKGEGKNIKVLSNVVSSQIEIHQKYGGVVPEIAAREHVLNMLPVIHEAMTLAGLSQQADFKKLDAIAVTVGPGLITSLITGAETAKTLAYSWNKPLVAVNHIEGHIYSNFIDNPDFNFPALIMTVSGGHTILVLMTAHGQYKILGETRDDAAGEAFDKAAQLMNLGYPGGPIVSLEAEKFQTENSSKENTKLKQIILPRPMLNSPDFDFSFSGLKTALRYELLKDKNWQKNVPEYCCEFQQSIIDVLIHKTIKAAKKYGAKTILLSGGVSANKELRLQFANATKNQLTDASFFVPALKYTTDNAVMVATNGYYKALKKQFTPWQELIVDCNLEL